MIKRILVGLGGLDYTEAAIRQAVALAKEHDAHLTGVSVIDEERLTNVGPVPIGGSAYAADLAEKRLEQAKSRAQFAMHTFEQAAQEAGIERTLIQGVGEPFEDLIALARYNDLMVFGLRSIFEYDVIEDPHDLLVRLVQAGVRPIVAVAKGFQEIYKVLIAYSGSIESAKAMKQFIHLRPWPAATWPSEARPLRRAARPGCPAAKTAPRAPRAAPPHRPAW